MKVSMEVKMMFVELLLLSKMSEKMKRLLIILFAELKLP